MAKICHILNPVKVNKTHDLYIAQPITFASMRAARNLTVESDRPDFLALGYPEDREVFPEGFRTALLPERSIRDVVHEPGAAKLPLLHDILRTAYENTDAEYIVYTNVDIAVQPAFYPFVQQKIAEGHDGFAINRRRIPAGRFTPDDLGYLYTLKGKSHPGFDCFIFRRELIPQMCTGTVCTGIPFVEATLAHNLFALCRDFRLYDRELLTFHLGMEIFKKRDPVLYWHNRRQFFGTVKPALWPLFDIRRFPYFRSGFPVRYIRWGLNPALFTLMNLKLDLRRIFKK